MGDLLDNLKTKLARKSERDPQGGTCILWTGRVTSSGYGLQTVHWPDVGRKVEKAHRVALMVEMRVTRSQFKHAGVECSHLCHSRLCVNPQHIVLESHATNQERIHCKSQGLCSKLHVPWCLGCKYSIYLCISFALASFLSKIKRPNRILSNYANVFFIVELVCGSIMFFLYFVSSWCFLCN